MKNKFFLMITVLMLLSTTLSICAESSISEIPKGTISFNEEHGTFAYKESGTSLYKIVDSCGNSLTPAIYTDAISRGEFFKVEFKYEDEIHNTGLLDAFGNVIIPPEYADIEIVDSRWQIGIKVIPSSADDKDYTYTNYSTGAKSYYRIASADFYLDGKKAGTLDRSQFGESFPNTYGKYIRVKDRSGNGVYYNSQMQPSPYKGQSSSGEYEEERKNRVSTYYHNGTGQIAFTETCTLTPDEVANPYLYVDYNLIDLQGNVIFTTATNYGALNYYPDGYFKAREYLSGGSRYGFLDMKGNVIVPVKYEEIGYTDHPFRFGYISAVRDGKFGFVDVNGSETTDFVYSRDVVRDYTTFAKLTDLSGDIIVISAAVGELPDRYKDVAFVDSDGSLAFVAENKNGEKCLIDIYGKEMIPCSDEYSAIYVNRDATTAVVTFPYSSEIIYVYNFDPPSAPTEDDTDDNSTWICSNGHSGNFGNFCPICGEPKSPYVSIGNGVDDQNGQKNDGWFR